MKNVAICSLALKSALRLSVGVETGDLGDALSVP